jgi:hypothetical protein
VSLDQAVRDALAIPAPAASQQATQEAVARRIDELSPGSSVKRTGYFNHSWIPDLVVGSKEDRDRSIFFRFDVKDPSFEEDLAYLSHERPLFLDLINGVDKNDGERTARQFDLEAALATDDRRNVLVTEVSAIDRFDAELKDHRDASTATQQVVLGGRGVVDPGAATSILESWQDAKTAAVGARPEDLRRALDEVDRYLDRIARLDLEQDLRSTWVAAGNDAEAFPGSEDWQLHDRSPREIAEFVASLVERDGEVTTDQWDAIARAVDLTSLGHELAGLDRSHEGGLVNDLVAAGMQYWTARFAYVPMLSSDSLSGRFDWSYGRYALSINLIRRRAYFTNNGHKWGNVPKAKALPELSDRLPILDDPTVLGAGIQTQDERVSHELREVSRKSLAELMSPMVDQGWRSARLNWLDLRVPGTTSTARVDFQRNVVSSRDPIPLRTYVILVAKFVAALNQDELQSLEERLPRIVDSSD